MQLLSDWNWDCAKVSYFCSPIQWSRLLQLSTCIRLKFWTPIICHFDYLHLIYWWKIIICVLKSEWSHKGIVLAKMINEWYNNNDYNKTLLSKKCSNSWFVLNGSWINICTKWRYRLDLIYRCWPNRIGNGVGQVLGCASYLMPIH